MPSGNSSNRFCDRNDGPLRESVCSAQDDKVISRGWMPALASSGSCGGGKWGLSLTPPESFIFNTGAESFSTSIDPGLPPIDGSPSVQIKAPLLAQNARNGAPRCVSRVAGPNSREAVIAAAGSWR